MQPGHIKLLLLILLMLGVGGYVFYVTNPQPTNKRVERKQVVPATTVSSFPAANVTNAHLEKKGATTLITGVAKDEIDPSLTSLGFLGTMASAPVRGSFDQVIADVFVDKRTLKGASVAAQAASLTTGHKELDDSLRGLSVLGAVAFPQISFVMTHLEKGQGRETVAVGNLTMHAVKQEIRVPFVRAGGGLRGAAVLDLGLFGMAHSGFDNNAVTLKFSLGVK